MPNSCKKCTKNITSIRNPGLSCVICNNYWHFLCADLTEKAFKDLTTNKFSWTCKGCKRRSVILPLTNNSAESLAPSSSTSNATASKTSETKQLIDSNRITKLEELLQSALLRIEHLELKISEKATETASLSSKFDHLESQAASLEKQLNDDVLEIQGLPETSLAHPLDSIVSIGEAIGCDISENDLICSPTRVLSKLSITFRSKAKRRNFLTAGKQFNREKKKFELNQQNYRIHINEPLSESQRKIYRETKTFARTHDFKFVWVGLGGVIYLKKSEGHAPFSITSSHALSTISNAPLLSELPRTENQGSPGSSINSAQ